MPDLGNTSVLSPTDGSNASGTMPSWNGSASPNTIDDAGRALQGAVAREWECRSFPASTGTAPSFVVAYTVAPAALRSGQTYTLTAHAAAAGVDTVNINALGAKTIKKMVSGTKTDLSANDFYANDKLALEYDGTDLVWVNWPGPASAALSAASTAETLTGTDTTKYLTADGVAALWEQGSDIASAGTISVGEGGYFNVTGTTTITDIDPTTDKAGRRFSLKFAGALTLTHNATSLILPGGANITTAAGDVAHFVSEGSDNVRCVGYEKADGRAVSSASSVMAFIGHDAATGTANMDFSFSTVYTKLLAVYTFASIAARSLEVSVDDGTGFGTGLTIASISTPGGISSGSVLIEGTGAAATNKTFSNKNVDMEDVDASFSSGITSATPGPETVKTGITTGVRFTGSSTNCHFTVTLYGIT